jgi:beta-glucosidase
MVQNKGQFAGKQVIQVYYTKPNSRIDRPIQELKAFAKTKEIASGKTEEINLEIPISELSFWDEKNDQWSLEKGLYHIKIGFSSRDIRILEEIEI